MTREEEEFHEGMLTAESVVERLILQRLIGYIADTTENPAAFRIKFSETVKDDLSKVYGGSKSFMEGMRHHGVELINGLVTPPAAPDGKKRN